MSPYIHTDSSSCTAATANGTVYDLYATVNHYGAVFAGHYVANVLAPNGDKSGKGVWIEGGEKEKEDSYYISTFLFLIKDWLRYDDENVTRISKKYISDSNTYLLFYRRREN